MVNPRNVEINLNLVGDSVNISILTSCSSSPDLNGDTMREESKPV